MKQLELYGRVRYAVKIQGMSRREAARVFGIDRRTVDKMLAFPTPPGYRRKKTPARPKLDPFVGIIDQILEDDSKRLKKQRHTSKRIFERLRDEYGFAGGITIVKDYIFAARQRQREMYVPLSHSPGHNPNPSASLKPSFSVQAGGAHLLCQNSVFGCRLPHDRSNDPRNEDLHSL